MTHKEDDTKEQWCVDRLVWATELVSIGSSGYLPVCI